MNVTFFHAGPAHPIVMAMMAGQSFTMDDGKGTTLTVRPMTEEKDYAVTVSGGASDFRDITAIVYLAGAISGQVKMSLKVTICDDGYCSGTGDDAPKGALQFWSPVGRNGPCQVYFS